MAEGIPNHDELLQACEGCVDLIFAWIKGPFNKGGVLWNNPEDYPPALNAAITAIANAKPKE